MSTIETVLTILWSVSNAMLIWLLFERDRMNKRQWEQQGRIQQLEMNSRYFDNQIRNLREKGHQ